MRRSPSCTASPGTTTSYSPSWPVSWSPTGPKPGACSISASTPAPDIARAPARRPLTRFGAGVFGGQYPAQRLAAPARRQLARFQRLLEAVEHGGHVPARRPQRLVGARLQGVEYGVGQGIG